MMLAMVSVNIYGFYISFTYQVCVMLTVVVLGGLLVGWWLTAAAC